MSNAATSSPSAEDQSSKVEKFTVNNKPLKDENNNIHHNEKDATTTASPESTDKAATTKTSSAQHEGSTRRSATLKQDEYINMSPGRKNNGGSAKNISSPSAGGSPTSRRPRGAGGRSSFDGNASVGSYQSTSSRSLMSGGGGGGSISRPAGMRERMQQRLRTAQSERHLIHVDRSHDDGGRNLHDPDDQESVGSTRSSKSSRRLGMPSSSVRDRLSTSWSKVPSIRRIVETPSSPSTSKGSSDDILLLQLTQKVRQLEQEKSRLMETQDSIQKEHEATVTRLQNKVKEEKATSREMDSSPKPRPSSPSTAGSGSAVSSSSAMLELQAKFDKAMAKVSRLEEEQSRREDLEEKYQDAQVTIANLRLQSSTTPVRRLSPGGAVAGTLDQASTVSDAQRILVSEEREDERMSDDRQQQVANEQRKAESPTSAKEDQPRPRAGSLLDANTTSVSISEVEADAGAEFIVGGDLLETHRSDKLKKLKEFRRSRESQLKELVLDNQNSPTDVQTVIRNLQDELKAAQQVMMQQKLQLKGQQDTMIQLQQQRDESMKDQGNDIEDDTPMPDNDSDVDTELSIWKEKCRSLQRKYTKLEMDRAWGEFQLRDRITNDALKFHRRLRHWKEQTQELQRQLEATMEQQAQEAKELRLQLSRQEEAALSAEQDLQEYKRGTQQTLKEFAATQDRLIKVTAQLAKYKPELSAEESSSRDPTVMQQSHFLESAKERKAEKQHVWPTPAGWMDKIRQRGGGGGLGEADPSIMG